MRFAPLADYIAVNISSPNTPGLRDLQERSAVTGLIAAIVEARRDAAKPVPILLKLAPDLDDAALEAIATAAIDNGIEGLIVTNTTIARDGIGDSKVAAETGGLSGRPLFRRSTAILARLRKLVGRKLVLIGVGGIDSAETAWEKMAAGADLIQVYTGMVYEGLGLAAEIAGGLSRRLDRERIASIGEIVGSQADRWARDALKRQPLEARSVAPAEPEQAHHQPYRHDDHRAQQEIAEAPRAPRRSPCCRCAGPAAARCRRCRRATGRARSG